MSTQQSGARPGEIAQAYAAYQKALAVAQSRRSELKQLEQETLRTREASAWGDTGEATLSTLRIMRGRLASLHRLIQEAHSYAIQHYTSFIALTEEANGIRQQLKQLEQHARKVDRSLMEHSSLTTPGAHLEQPDAGWNPYPGSISDVELSRLTMRLHELVGT